MDNERDIYLIKRTLNGDNEAFGQLIDSYKRQIYQFIYRKIPKKRDVVDLAQEVFIKVYIHLFRLYYQQT